MKTRLSIFIICSLLSGLTISTSLEVPINQIAMLIGKFGSSCLDNSWCTERLYVSIIRAILWPTAWGFYFIISYRWVRFGYVGKKIRIAGATVGTCALLASHIFGIFLTLPAIILMLHIHFKVPYGPTVHGHPLQLVK